MGGCELTFTKKRKNGEVFEHPNGYVYEYSAGTYSWNKTQKTELPKVEPERRTRKRPSKTLKVPAPTLEVIPTMTEVEDNG